MTRLAWLLAVVLAASAHAGPSSAQAEVFFRNGKRLLKLGKIGEACAAFDASQKLDPTISTRLNQANCREKNNQLATAWGLFLDAERDTRSATDDAGKQLHQVAVDHADKLEARLSTLEIRVSTDVRVDGLEILRDGELVDPMAWNQSLPIDGGVYKIVARTKNEAEWSTTVAIANEKDAKTVEIPKRALRDSKKPAPVKPPPATPAAAKSAAPDNWYCTQSNYSKLGGCKPQLEQCEAFRDKMLAHVHDLSQCAAAASATCFVANGEPHCAPTPEMCDAMRDAATRTGTTAVGACGKVVAKAAPAAVALSAAKATGKTEDVDFDDAPDATWSCTESKRSPVGTCKPNRDQCETFRAKLLERFQDLSECHPVAKAQCFDVGKEPHCAQSQSTCDALREAAKVSGHCTARAVK